MANPEEERMVPISAVDELQKRWNENLAQRTSVNNRLYAIIETVGQIANDPAKPDTQKLSEIRERTYGIH